MASRVVVKSCVQISCHDFNDHLELKIIEEEIESYIAEISFFAHLLFASTVFADRFFERFAFHISNQSPAILY